MGSAWLSPSQLFMISERVITIPDSQGFLASQRPPITHGWFFILRPRDYAWRSDLPQNPRYYTCRESIGVRLAERPRVRLIGYVNSGIKIKDLADRWWELEDRLKIDHSVFHKTDNGKAIMIRMNHWWFKNTTRKSIMTLLMRGLFVHHVPNDFWGFLFKYQLARGCSPAIKAFVDQGRTVPTYHPMSLYNKRGFVGMFNRLRTSTINKLLTHDTNRQTKQKSVKRRT